jgi:hypothetical protein
LIDFAKRRLRVLQKYPLSEPFTDVRSDISFYFPEMPLPIRVFLDPLSHAVKIKKGSPKEVLELNDVYIVNGEGMNCLYDADGHRILQSCVRRGESGNECIEAYVEKIDIPDECDNISEPIVYLSSFYRHWGHFLTESISRLWARHEYPELRGMKGLYRSYFRDQLADYQYITDYFSSSTIEPIELLSVKKITKIDKCFLPAASFSNRNEGYTSHLTSPHDVARSYLGDMSPDRRNQPIYMSRSRLTKFDRKILNEAELTNVLVNHGVRVIYPEEMSLEEQITIFNTHSVFIGCCGSAFHSTLFSLASQEITTFVLCERWINPNYIMIDAIVGNTSNYMCVLTREDPEKRGDGGVRMLKIDVGAAIAQLRQCGVV